MVDTAPTTPVEASDIQVSIDTLIDILKKIDRGDDVSTNFMSRSKVNAFCALVGIRSWGDMIDKQIADENVFPNTSSVVPKDETLIILNLLKAELDKGDTFTPDTENKQGKLEPFNKDVLNDFLKKDDTTGDYTAGDYIWEYQFGLKVELEHGRTRGANVTNNHPLLTGIIVMAHLTEDTLYYARLWVMEVEGEIFNNELERLKVKPEDVLGLEAKLADLKAELAIAKMHLAFREAEKLRKPQTPANS